MLSFQLDHSVVHDYRARPNPMTGLGAFVAERTYYRPGEDWADVCQRVINGMYSLQKDHVPDTRWHEDKAQRSAKEAYDLMFNLKWTPPGRGMWAMGTDFVHLRGHSEALQNCAFISSKWIHHERGDFFRWIMENLMFGVGVGFDVEGAGRVDIVSPDVDRTRIIQIGDSREAWADSVKHLVNSYMPHGPFRNASIEFDYTRIRPRGVPIRGFGGVASGPEPLKELHDSIHVILGSLDGKPISMRAIADIGNLIGVCVIAGNVRRSAEIILGMDRGEFKDLKSADMRDERPWMWASNNSVLARVGQDYSEIAARTYENGEPGAVWLENARQYGRMGFEMPGDEDAVGFNPCGEQVLHHREMCTLAETYLPNITSKLEYARVIKVAYLYAKSVTLASKSISDEKSRAIMQQNGRIGLSASGVAEFREKRGDRELVEWFNHGHEIVNMWDNYYSMDWLDVNPAVRHTSIKPSGTVRFLANTTAGVHYPTSTHMIRRVRVADDSPLVERVERAGYHVEPDVVSAGTAVIEFPVSHGNMRSVREVPLLEQLHVGGLAGRWYADNAVSITASFDKSVETPETVAEAYEYAEKNLKAVSMLPLQEEGEATFAQMPEEPISESRYLELVENVKPLDTHNAWRSEDHVDELFCDGDTCEI